MRGPHAPVEDEAEQAEIAALKPGAITASCDYEPSQPTFLRTFQPESAYDSATGASMRRTRMDPTVLVIDDEPQIRRVVHNALSAEMRVLEAATGRAGIDVAAAERPALIVLDLGLPDVPGASVCREIRKWSTAPIIVLSARHLDAEKVALLDAGADDYITKPFSTTEFQARVRAQLRRARLNGHPSDAGPLIVGELAIDVAKRTLSRHGKRVHLTPTEWDLLRAFVKHAGRTLTHRQIFREVWGGAAGDAQAYLRVHIANLRRKIEPDPVRPSLIITEPGVGYRFDVDA